jgi:hypothetical protein
MTGLEMNVGTKMVPVGTYTKSVYGIVTILVDGIELITTDGTTVGTFSYEITTTDNELI